MSRRPVKSLRGKVKTAVAPEAPPSPAPLLPPVVVVPVTETLEGLLTRQTVGGQPLITKDQATDLMELTLIGNIPLLSLTDRPFVYEIIGMMAKSGFNLIYQYLTSRPWTSTSEIVFMAPAMTKARQKVLADMEIFRDKIIAGKSIFKCRRCGSDETIQAEKQTRSADEPMTVKVTCVACSNSWIA